MNQWGKKLNFIFSFADALHGPYKPNRYGNVILPLTVRRRLDCVLADTGQKVLATHVKHKDTSAEVLEKQFNRTVGQRFQSTSNLDLASLTRGARRLSSGITSGSGDRSYYDGYVQWGNSSELRKSVIHYTSAKLTQNRLLNYWTVEETLKQQVYKEILDQASAGTSSAAGH